MTTIEKAEKIIIALLDRLEEIDADYWQSQLVADADDILKEIEGQTD